MDAKTFNDIVETQIALSTEVLVKKADEYATDDRLHNFRVAGAIQGVDSVTALAGMMAKHSVSIYDMIADTSLGERFTLEMWEEKIGDHINYLLLLKALVVDEKLVFAEPGDYLDEFFKKLQPNETV
jgi:hypothetical protein